MNVDFLLFEGMDLMDFAGPWEVLLTANRLLERRGEQPVFDLVAFSPDDAPVRSYGGLQVTPTGVARPGGILVVPGTIDVPAATGNHTIMASVRDSGDRTLVASVCTGAFLLQSAALLPSSWTTHWEDIASMPAQGGSRARVVDTGRIITAGGIGCGIDLGLHLVARFVDTALARLVARQIDYPWDFYGDPSGGGIPVVVEREIAAPPHAVYQAWTSGQFLGQDRQVQPRIGGPYEIYFLDAADGERGGEGCRILAMEPDRLLVFTWNSPPGFATRGQHTQVVVTLEPTAQGTMVRLSHIGHGQGPEWDANRDYFGQAWPRVLQSLSEALDSR
jgi:uncharacterized protein YndB with AHSA1/START domain/putative intracellular protease/amidase